MPSVKKEKGRSKMKKSRILAVILSLAMVFSMAGISGFNVSAAAKLNKKKITISVGQTVKLKVKKNSKKVKWKSSNKKIVTVSKKGKIKGKKVGKATITAKIGKKKLKCKVKVVAKKTKNDKTVKPANPSQVPAQTTKAPNQSQAPVATTKAPDKPQPPVTTKGQDQPQTPAATTKGQDQPQTPAATTKSQEPATTAKPTTPDDGKPSPKEVFGQNILNKKGLQVTFTWGSDEEIINSGQVFNIYYDGVAGEQGVAAGVITHTFETEGEHSIVIKGSLNGKESQGVELKVTLQNREPGQVTTAPSTDGAEWVELKGDPENANTYFYDKKTMNLNEIVDIQQPGWAAEKGIYMNVASGISEVTVNGLSENVGKIEGAGVIIYLSALTREINEVSIKHAQGTGYVKIRNTKASGGVIQPTTKVPEATQPATTKAPQPTTKKNDTTQPAIDFTTDSSIAKPFGMQVEAAGTGYLRVVWGRGDIDCYNVYVDGERRRTGVSCGSFTLPVYTDSSTK